MSQKYETSYEKSSREIRNKRKKGKKQVNECGDHQASRHQRISFRNFLEEQDKKFYEFDDFE
ncbi:MAG: hypothetical protein QXN55_01435 [Candidatus Nitrosotenuis sp.]